MNLRTALGRLLGGGRGIGLALSGGGARGLAHIGVLAVLEEHKLPVSCIVGTSAGAIVGAMWLVMRGAAAVETRWREFLAAGFPSALPDANLAEDVSSRDSTLLHFARTLRRGTAVALALGRRSLVERSDFERALAFLLPDITIEELDPPFAAVATDFLTGRPVALRSGSLRLAVSASSAIPGVLPACRVGDRTLVDGGVVADVPVRETLNFTRRPIVAVDVSDLPADDDPDAIKVPRALLRAGQLTHGALRTEILRDADLVLRPAVADVHWSEFARLEECVAAGREAALQAIGSLREKALGRGRRKGR